MFEKFVRLDQRINSVGDLPVQIGNRLRTLHRQRNRALRAQRLTEYFQQFQSGNVGERDPIFADEARIHEVRHGRMQSTFFQWGSQAAGIARLLSVLASELEAPDVQAVRTFHSCWSCYHFSIGTFVDSTIRHFTPRKGGRQV